MTSNLKPILPNPLTLECNVVLKSLRNNHIYIKKQKKNVVKRVIVDCDVSDNEEDKQITFPSKASFIVYWTSLKILLKHCLHSTCLMPATITNLAFKGSQLIVRLKCQDGHETEWKSQLNCHHYSVGNPTNVASVLFSANTYQRFARFFDLAGIQWISKTSFYAIQNCYLYGIVNRNYIEKSKAILEDMKQAKSIHLSGDGRCNSPGHNPFFYG